MSPSEILLYQTEDGLTRIDLRLEGETLWLTQNQMAELFQTSKQNISLHLKNVFSEGELAREATVKEYLTVQTEGGKSVNRHLEHYNFDAVLKSLPMRAAFPMMPLSPRPNWNTKNSRPSK